MIYGKNQDISSIFSRVLRDSIRHYVDLSLSVCLSVCLCVSFCVILCLSVCLSVVTGETLTFDLRARPSRRSSRTKAVQRKKPEVNQQRIDERNEIEGTLQVQYHKIQYNLMEKENGSQTTSN